MARCSQGTRDTLPFLVSNEPSRNLYSGLPVDVQPANASLRLALCFLPSSSTFFLSFFPLSYCIFSFFFLLLRTISRNDLYIVFSFFLRLFFFWSFFFFFFCSRDETRWWSISSTIGLLFVLSGRKFSNGLKDGER